MSNIATSLFKITLLAGGAVLGTLVARWIEETIVTRMEEQADYDKTRYEQGLSPIVVTPIENQN